MGVRRPPGAESAAKRRRWASAAPASAALELLEGFLGFGEVFLDFQGPLELVTRAFLEAGLHVEPPQRQGKSLVELIELDGAYVRLLGLLAPSRVLVEGLCEKRMVLRLLVAPD